MRNAFCFAVLFLTRIPVPTQWQHFDAKTQSQSLYWHPAVGFVIGALLLGGYQLTQLTGLAQYPLPSAGLVLILWVLITGGLHLDGLGDAADGWLGGYGDKDRTLDIMKDSHSGAAAIMAIASLLILKVSALSAVLSLSPYWLLIVPVFARLTSIMLFATTPYVRAEGLGSPFADTIRTPYIAVLFLLITSAMVWYGGLTGFWVALGGVVILALLRRHMIQRIGGTTGDTAGATIEIIEAFSLVLVLAAT